LENISIFEGQNTRNYYVSKETHPQNDQIEL
jgi:hypothetical protein